VAEIGKRGEALERGQEDATIGVFLAAAPLLERLAENLANITLGPWGNDDVNI
jgi:hypothetical protein